MTRRVGPYASIAAMQAAATLVKQLQPGATIEYLLQVGEAETAKAKPKARAKKSVCPDCGKSFDTPQALGPHSRSHKRAAEKQSGNGRQEKPLPANTEAVAS